MNWVKNGVAFYEDLAEDESQRLVFLWGVKDKDEVLDVLEWLGLDKKLVRDGKFWALKDVRFEAGGLVDVRKALSFLFGAALLRGDFEVKSDRLVHLKVFLPVFEARKEEFIAEVKEVLGTEAVVIKENVVQKGKNKVFEWNLDDEEVLDLFGSWLGLEGN